MNKELLRIREARAKVVAKMRALHDAAVKADRDFSPEEQAEYSACEQEAAAFTSRIERDERLSETERRAVVARDPKDKEEEDTDLVPGGQRVVYDSEPSKLPKPFRSFGEQLGAVIRAGKNPHDVDPKLFAVASGLNEAVPSEGGFMVQTDYSGELLKRTYEQGQILSRIRTIPISANANGLKLKGIDETSRATGSRFGGVQSYWVDEAGTVTAKKPKFREMALDLKKLMGVAYLTDELTQDASALEAVVNQAFADEFTFKIEDAVISGTGSGQPLGILNSPSLVTVLKEGGQAAATFQKENVFKMWARCWGRSRLNAVWLINQDVEPALFGMTLGQLGIYFPGGTFANSSGYGTLMGRPVIPVEYCSTLGTIGDVILGDFSQYLAIDKGGFRQATSIHVRFLNDEMTLKFTYRIDGQPLWHSVLTPYKGTNTLSPFVVLETR